MDELTAERRPNGDAGEDLLSMLHAAQDEDGSTLRDKEPRDNLLTSMFAGHEIS